MHGVQAAIDIVDANGRDIGDIFTDYVRSQNADLLVMGAFGHSRVRDFVLGGATRSMLRQPALPLFLSH
jgi:nucleotide-binding universal stress UspA family protein